VKVKNNRRKRANRGRVPVLICGVLTAVCIGLLIAIFVLLIQKKHVADDEQKPATQESSETAGDIDSEISKGDDISQADTEEKEEPATVPEKEKLEVHFIDVGQGDATLIKFGEHAMLVDTGSADPEARRSDRDLLEYLKKNGVEKLSYLLLTHGHEDHMGRACDILQAMDVDKVICDFGNQEGYVQRLQQMLEDMEKEVIIPQMDQEYALGEATVHIITGRVAALDEQEYETETERVNNQSVGIRVSYGENSFLLYGDGEAAYEKYLLESDIDLQADVLKVPHHGAAVSCSQEILDAVQPEYTVISSAKQEDFGFPSGEVLTRMMINQITTFYTNRQGNVIAVSDGEHISFTTRR